MGSNYPRALVLPLLISIWQAMSYGKSQPFQQMVGALCLLGYFLVERAQGRNALVAFPAHASIDAKEV